MNGFFSFFADLTVYFSILYPLLYLKGFVVNNKAFKIFTVYILVIGIIQIHTILVIKVYNMESNLFLSHFYFILQFFLLSMFYKELLQYKWIYYVLGATVLFLVYQYIKEPNLFTRYNAAGMFITQIILVCYALMYMYRSLSSKGQFTIVNVGLFIYLLSSSLIFACGNLQYSLDVPAYFSEIIIDINLFLYLAFQILVVLEWYFNYRKPRSLRNDA